jgi:hypothetical protein
MAFYPGQQVVCVSARIIPGATNKYLHMLEEGNIYIVREIVEHPKFLFLGYGLYVDKVWLPKSDATGNEEAWCPLRFRPCVKTDISVFTSLLEKVPADLEDCDA